MKLYSYVVARDFGFAPNPFYGFCTLSSCKPKIRQSANKGDWVVGVSSIGRGQDINPNLVYTMKITEKLTFQEYWNDPRFLCKRPVLNGSIKQVYDDNIYHKNSEDKWFQEPSHHTLPNNEPNKKNLKTDTKSDNVLISQEYYYLGNNKIEIPNYIHHKISITENSRLGHRVTETCNDIGTFLEWINSLKLDKVNGDPLHWNTKIPVKDIKRGENGY